MLKAGAREGQGKLCSSSSLRILLPLQGNARRTFAIVAPASCRPIIGRRRGILLSQKADSVSPPPGEMHSAEARAVFSLIAGKHYRNLGPQSWNVKVSAGCRHHSRRDAGATFPLIPTDRPKSKMKKANSMFAVDITGAPRLGLLIDL
jgi:hypothetical protein